MGESNGWTAKAVGRDSHSIASDDRRNRYDFFRIFIFRFLRCGRAGAATARGISALKPRAIGMLETHVESRFSSLAFDRVAFIVQPTA
jgi:hypothetical protein